MEIPKECYEYGSSMTQMSKEATESFEIEALDAREDLKLIIKGAMFPYRACVGYDTLFAANMCKSLFIESIKIFSRPRFIIGSLLTFVSKKKTEQMLLAYNRIAFRILSPHMLKDRHLSPFAREMQWAIFEFLRNIGITEDTADRFASIFAHLLEFDDAYRIRIQDIASTTTIEKLHRPQELSRLAGIMAERSGSHPWTSKLTDTALLMDLMLKIPRAKKAYLKVLEGLTLESLQLEDADIYWGAYKDDYDLMGLTKEQRKEYAKTMGWTYPAKLV